VIDSLLPLGIVQTRNDAEAAQDTNNLALLIGNHPFSLVDLRLDAALEEGKKEASFHAVYAPPEATSQLCPIGEV
jgi:hypothetical protein